jgi:hypothetical protein
MKAAASLLGLQQTRFLHPLVQCNPPIELVAKLIEALPDQLTLLDKRPRTVLHTAAGSTASPELIRLCKIISRRMLYARRRGKNSIAFSM